MNRITDVLRIIFVSPEMAAIAVCIWLHSISPNLFEPIGKKIETILTALPIVAVLVATHTLCDKILFPKEHNTVLLQWPQYSHLKNRCIFSLCTSVVAAVTLFICIVFSEKIPNTAKGFVFILFFVPACIALLTVALAQWKIREIIEITDSSTKMNK
jgi:hypothetical protein